MTEHTSLPTFLEVDPYPASPNTRPVSGISSVASIDDFSSARERQSTLPSPTGVVEIGLPPSRIRQSRSPRESLRPGTATHIPIEAAGFANPLSSQLLQRQRAPVAETESRRRYSIASVNTLREAQEPVHEDIPPLPSRGTDAPQSVNSTAPLRPAQPPQPSSPVPITGHKNYEFYAGNTIFILGLCIQTRARPFNIFTAFCIILPAALFFGFSAPFLWTVSPAIPIIYAYVFYLTISSFAHAAFSEPGVLPRNIHPVKAGPLDVPQTEWVMIKGDLEQAMEVPTKFCKTCMIQRPPRAHHCRTCDHCVETQDHHCVWLNNCVGRRNYRYFFSFIASATLMAILQIAFTATHISKVASENGIGFGDALNFGNTSQTRVSLAMMIYAILAFAYPFSLLMYHIFLMSRGETTREYLNSHKFPVKDRHRPFSLGLSKNLLVVLLRPRPPSYMEFKRKHETGDVRYGHMKPKAERQHQYKGRYSVEMKQMK